MRITYLTLQATGEGQAAYAHVHEIIAGLERRGFAIKLWDVQYAREPTKLGRAVAIAVTQAKALTSLRKSDAVYVRNHFLAAPFVWVSAVLFRRPVVIEVNGTHEDSFIAYPALRRLRKIIVWLSTWQLRVAKLVICVTPELAVWAAAAAPGTRTAVVPNGANTRLFDPKIALASPSPVPLPESFVVFFGALSKWQGVDTMLAATRHAAWPEGLGLVIVGDGADRSTVAEAALRTPERIHYLGQQPYNVIPAIVSRSKGSLIVKEGPFDQGGLLPLKLFESLACDVPVVVTDYPGIRDVVLDEGLGIVIPPRDPAALARCLTKLVNWQASRCSSAREWVVAGNSWDARAEQTSRLLTELQRETS